jgi:hypothetical protein
MSKSGSRPSHRYEHPVLIVNGGALTAGELMHVSARFGAGLRLEAVPARHAWDYLLARGEYSRRDESLTPMLIVYFPGEDGCHFDLLAKLRSRPALKRMPFVLLTEDGQPCGETEAKGLGPVLYWKRPAGSSDYDALTKAIISLVG